ncbi:MAG: hypothetical protein KDC18_01345 [Alphaproteobacteria bacterium]|nr:hypothetical protein [Alphaproteobacteria bacterium]MCB9928206.1 hypothetical protein [Alphaproteobacteria bacterium]
MSDPSPIGLFNYAHSFWSAGRALIQLDWEKQESHPDSPAEFLYWHSIELFLKAYLLADGVPLSKLRSPKIFGHDLSKLLTQAKARGLALTRKDEALISFMPVSKDMIALRYLKVGVKTVPTHCELEATCLSLYEIVARELQNRGINIGFHAKLVSLERG